MARSAPSPPSSRRAVQLVMVATVTRKREEVIVTTGDMLVEKGRVEGEQKGRVEGRAEGRAEAVLMLLTARDVTLSAAERERVLTCRDLVLLDRWLVAAATASSSSSSDVFA